MNLIRGITTIIAIAVSTTLQAVYGQGIDLKNNIINPLSDKQVNIEVQYPTAYASGIDELSSHKANFTTTITALSRTLDSINKWSYSVISNIYSDTKVKYQPSEPKALTRRVLTLANQAISDNMAACMSASSFQYITSWSGFSNGRLISVFISKYLFTGGANGSNVGVFATFSSGNGSRIDLRAEIGDTTRLLECAAEILSKDRGYPRNATKEQTGLFVELSQLPMPRNLGLNKKGLILYYNMYEIGPRVQGEISITVPYSELQGMGVKSLSRGKAYNEYESEKL